MQFYDIIMLVVMGGSILFGLWKGFAWQVASVAAIFVSYFVSRTFNEPVAQMIGGDPAWNRFLAMFILFMGTSLVIWLLFGVVRNTIEKLHLTSFDRQAGAALGAFKGAILCTLVTLFSVSLLGDRVCKSVCTSFSGNYIARVLGHAGGIVPPEIGQYIQPHIDNFHEKMENHQQENPDSQTPQSPFGTGQGMTQTGGPQERVGQLQRVPGTQANQPGNGQTFNGQFQIPTLEDIRNGAQKATQDAARDAAGRLLEDAWNRVQNGGGQ